MKNRIHTMATVLLTLLFVVSVFPQRSNAADVVATGTCGENVHAVRKEGGGTSYVGGDNATWSLFDDGTLYITGEGAMGDYENWTTPMYFVKDKYNITLVGVFPGITRIGNNFFYGCDSISVVVLAEGVETIGKCAFYMCSGLTEIVLQDGLTTIEKDAFSHSGLERITLPNGLRQIESNAFWDCSKLKEIILPDGLSEISDSTFYFCSALKSITIPDSITKIGAGAFQHCDSLTDVYYSGSRDEWSSLWIGENNEALTNATIHFGRSDRIVESPSVQVSTQKLAVDGVEKAIEHYNIDGSNYFKLRDLACLLAGTSNAFDVGYDSATRTVTVTTGAVYTPLATDLQIGADESASAMVSSQSLTINGEVVSLTAYNIGGSNYFMLRDLAPYLGFDVDYNAETRTALILTNGSFENGTGDEDVGDQERESQDGTGYKRGDHIRFGQKNGQALTWEVLSISDGIATLLCDHILDVVILEAAEGYRYSDSSLQKWCSAFYSSDYFTDDEWGAILTTTVDGLADQTFFVLSEREFFDYFPEGVGGKRNWLPGVSGEYGAIGLGTSEITDDDPVYWLRSIEGAWLDLVSYDEDGRYSNATCINIHNYSSSYGICPAVRVDLTKIVDSGTSD